MIPLNSVFSPTFGLQISSLLSAGFIFPATLAAVGYCTVSYLSTSKENAMTPSKTKNFFRHAAIGTLNAFSGISASVAASGILG
jgi:hypothetical protein